MTPRSNKYLATLDPPHPKQAVGMLLPHGEVLFGGAAGGGKSDWLLRSALQYVDVPGYSAIIFRRIGASLWGAGGLIPRSQNWLQGTDAVWNQQRMVWTFPNGATLKFGYIDKPTDRYQYASQEFQFIGFEELTEFPREDDYSFLFSRIRRPDVGELAKVPLRMRATTNPIGVGFAWVKARFVPGGQPINIPPSGEQVGRFFLPSSLEDNPSIRTEEYERSLRAMGDDLVYKKLRNGDWSDLVAGEYFPKVEIEQRILQPHQAPKTWVDVRMWDLAGTRPSPTNTNPDWSAGVLIGKFGRKEAPEYLIRHVRRFRESPEDTERIFQDTTRSDGKLVYARMLQDPAQAGKYQAVNYAKGVPGYDFDAIPAPRGKNRHKDDNRSAKELNAVGLSAQWRKGNVWLVQGTWTEAFVEELDSFPYGSKDDQVDAACSGFNFLLEAKPKSRGYVIGPRLG